MKFSPSTPTGAIGAESKPSLSLHQQLFCFSQRTRFLRRVGKVESKVGAFYLFYGSGKSLHKQTRILNPDPAEAVKRPA